MGDLKSLIYFLRILEKIVRGFIELFGDETVRNELRR